MIIQSEIRTVESLIYLGAIWGRVVGYLYNSQLYTPFENIYSERQARRWILKSDAYMISLLVLRNQLIDDRAMTLRQLSKALAPEEGDEQKNMATKIKKIIGYASHFELMCLEDDIHEITGQPVIRVKALNNLIYFYNDVIIPSLPEGFSVEINQ